MLEGFVKSITYRNEDNGYTIFKLCELHSEESHTVVGDFPLLNQGEQLQIEGDWIEHPKFGKQFKVSTFEVIPPKNEEAIIRYLSSGLFTGIGPITAQRIVDELGANTLELLSDDPSNIRSVPGFSEKKAKEFIEDWQNNVDSKEALYFLYQCQIPASTGYKIFKKFGSNTISKVRENPYLLIDEIWGIGFVKADQIARQLNVEKESFFRIRASLLYTLEQASLEGHTFLEHESLIYQASKLVSEPGSDQSERVLFSLDHLVSIDKIIKWKSAFYLPYLFKAEKGVASRIESFLSSPPLNLKRKFNVWLSEFEHTNGFEFSEEQKEHIHKAITEPLFVLTGGPGTGKTTTLLGIVHILKELGRKFYLTAPTGRASKRMSEVCRIEARTIHRLLKYEPSTKSFFHNEENPLNAKTIIVDEVSMVDISLMFALAKAIPSDAHLILIGDKDQLPSVGPGNVLKDLLNCQRIPRGVLTFLFRQDSNSDIAYNAHKIISGEDPEFSYKTNFHLRTYDNMQEAQNLVADLVAKHLPEHFQLDPLVDVQVLCPMHKGNLGTVELNQILQDRLITHQSVTAPGKIQFKIGDKVMQLKNNYETNIFNGDVGYITHINKNDKTVHVEFHETITYEFNELDQISHAYACTIHKSQGSEYKVAIIVLDSSHHVMLQRNLIYTAITRAKERCFLISNYSTLQTAIRNNKISERNSKLTEFLEDTDDFLNILEDSDSD